MNAGADPRLLRLLGGEMLAPLRQRLRRRYEQAPPGAQPTVLRLGGLSESEHAALAALLGRPARYAASMQVDVETIDTALRAAGIAPTLHDALEALDGPVLHRAAERERAQALWSTLAQGCEPPLRGLLEDPRGLGLVKRLARQDVAVARELCRQVDAVLRCLPARGLPRAQLAAQILGDAHALDDGQPVAALVVAVLREQREVESAQANADDLTEAERRRGRWASAGVLVNELARPALCLNLPMVSPPGEPSYLSLRWLLRASPVWHVREQAICVCENPNVIAIAADHLGAHCRPLVCTDGMPAAAQRTLLTQLAGAGARLHYHGDFDWPGLAIGNYLMRALGAQPWRFGADDYEAALPNASRPGRSLDGRSVVALWDAALAAVMQRSGLAIAEEALAETLLPDLDCRA